LAARGYQPEPYDGPAIVVAGLGNPNDQAEWCELLTGEVRFVSIDGEHSAMMREPYVGAVAEALLQRPGASLAPATSAAFSSGAQGAMRA
jgi:thioesterase domain-containing protein